MKHLIFVIDFTYEVFNYNGDGLQYKALKLAIMDSAFQIIAVGRKTALT